MNSKVLISLIFILGINSFTLGCTEKKNEGLPMEIIETKTKVDRLLQSMSLEEKVGQMFIIASRNISDTKPTPILTDTMKKTIEEYKVGGYVFFSDDLGNEDQLKEYISGINNSLELKPFIAVDEEGGTVARIYKNGQMGMPKIPSAKSIGDKNDVGYTLSIGELLGDNLKRLGFNMDFAPVMDINTNPDNPVIGIRALSRDESIVAKLAVEEAKGMIIKNVIPVVKHFPGHGDTSDDSHLGFVSIPHDMNRLSHVELVPFKAAVANNLPAIMIGHLSVPTVTGNNTPASLSKEMINDLLIDEMGFKGVVITDALDMGAINKNYTQQEVVHNAVNAGVDILLMPNNFYEAYDDLLDSVRRGDISVERINVSVRKILILKDAYNILN